MSNRKTTTLLSALIIGAAGLITTLGASAASYEVDSAHSGVSFKIKSRDTYFVHGIFGQIAGKASLGNADASKNSMEFTVKAASVHTGNDKRDEHLRGPDFFNSKQFPDIKFVANSVSVEKDGDLKATGTLTMLGVSKPITVELDKVGEGKNKDVSIVGYEAEFTVDRTEFGMKYGAGSIDNKVKLTVYVNLSAK
jgi:polyisoprenoid-binding protein YceI